jgi:DNA transposition AAA+ family ATPase
MTEETHKRSKTAALQNVALFLELVESLRDAPHYLDRYGVFYGESGLGKTTAATHASISMGCAYIECGSSWSTGKLVDALAHELNLGQIKGAVHKRVDEIIRCLADDPVTLLLDEADHLIKKSMIDLVREIGDQSRAPVIFIGERDLPKKLQAFERGHNRIMEWVQSKPCSFNDAKKLLQVYAPDVAIADDLLRKTVADTYGSTRRIVNNIFRYTQFAKTRGWKSLDLAQYTGEIYKGMPFPQKKDVA